MFGGGLGGALRRIELIGEAFQAGKHVIVSQARTVCATFEKLSPVTNDEVHQMMRWPPVHRRRRTYTARVVCQDARSSGTTRTTSNPGSGRFMMAYLVGRSEVTNGTS